MKTGHKTHSAPLGMIFLFLSLVLVPASIKFTGFSPSFSGMVQAWNQIAGVFGSGYQPASTTDLIALNQPERSEPSAPANESCCQGALLASLESPDYEETEVKAADVPVQPCSVERPAPGTKAIKRAVARKAVVIASSTEVKTGNKDFRIVAFDVQEMTSVEPVIQVETLKALEKAATSKSLNLTRIMNGLPAPKEVKVLWRFNQKLAPAIPNISRCGDTKNPAPDAERALRRRQRNDFESGPTEGPELSEL